jgi:Fur family iron response transcriptional regulator
VSDLIALLRSVGLQPTPQRLAVARFVLGATSHPTADQVLAKARKECPTLSRATVYNTLARLAERGLLRPQTIREGVVVFDAHTERHHHFIDEATGRIYDVPWEALSVTGEKALDEFDIRDYQVVMRGRKRRS